ncbi:hypothetical protein GMRT_10716 [Giardia muris]|uniref:RNI-like protein n=1 Tax=Giardia muris TaxID=5742 RepID=A0A4Z1SSR1_GIAMU|nr:hypothetical protein GMRT_10716 [Giardia muris]|eukprot:TNJ28962.1 hypothetical protein GMRT_10716 [Giardia muris]
MVDAYCSACTRLGIPTRPGIIQFLREPTKKLNLYGAQPSLYKSRITDADVEALVTGLLERNPPDFILDLGYNGLTDAALPHVSKLVSTLNLIGLSLKGNRLTQSGAMTYVATANFLTSSTCQLQYLDLSCNDFGPEGTEAIMRAIFNSDSLHFGVYINHPYMAADIKRVRRFGYLEYLDMSSTGFGEKANLYLCEFLSSRFCGLRELRLSQCEFTAVSGCEADVDYIDTGFHRLAGALRYNTSLEALTLRSNRCLDDTAAVAIIRALVSECPETDSGHLHISTTIGKKRMDDYKAYTWRLGQTGGQSDKLSEPLPPPLPSKAVYEERFGFLGERNGDVGPVETGIRIASTPLRYLDLASNRLCFDVALAIADHLKYSDCVLETIILDGVSVKNKGINALAKSLVRYTPCRMILDELAKKYVDEQGISLNDPAIERFGPITRRKEGSVYLSLRRTAILGQGLATLALLARHNGNIKYVAIEGNTLNPESGESGTINEGKTWLPDIEWEETFKARLNALDPVEADFGLRRNEDNVLQFYRNEALPLTGLHLFGLLE